MQFLVWKVCVMCVHVTKAISETSCIFFKKSELERWLLRLNKSLIIIYLFIIGE